MGLHSKVQFTQRMISDNKYRKSMEDKVRLSRQPITKDEEVLVWVTLENMKAASEKMTTKRIAEISGMNIIRVNIVFNHILSEAKKEKERNRQ